MSKYVFIIAVVSFLILASSSKAGIYIPPIPTVLCEPVRSQAYVTNRQGSYYTIERAPLLDTFCKK